MPELDEYDVMDSPAEAARRALEVDDRLRQIESTVGPVVTAQQALNFVPQTRTDLTRLPGQVFPPVDPSRLASKVIGGPSPAVIPDPTAEMLDTARRFGVSPEVVIRAEQARRQYEAQQGIRADIDAGMPESAAIAKWSGGLFPNLRSTSGLFTRPAQTQYRNIAGQLVKIPPGGEPEVVPGMGRAPADPAREALLKAAIGDLNAANRKLQATTSTEDEKKEAYENVKDARRRIAAFSSTPVAAPAVRAPIAAPATVKTLDRTTAQAFLDRAKGDKAEARRLARAAGYEL